MMEIGCPGNSISRSVWISDICIVLKEILSSTQRSLDEMIAVRRHIHQHPELSFNEEKTAAFVAARLKEYGIEVHEGIAGHGLVGLIKGRGEGKCIALRADMDALPILEEPAHEYGSINKGVMHACGHDAHTAMLLGAAKSLNQMRDRLEGTVKLVFQPAEEKLPGGASLMIAEGVLENPTPAYMLGQHVTPELDCGKVAFRSGAFMASADEIHLTIKGKGGHAAMPQLLIDPVLITSHLIVSLQQIVSRRSTPWIPSVLSFGKVIANGATNVIPSEVEVQGTFRTFDETWRKEVHDLLPSMIQGLVESMGGKVEIDLRVGYPVLKNDASFTARSRQVAIDLLGVDNVVDTSIRMGAEDFAFYSHQVPSCFFRLGTGSEKAGTRGGLHTPAFDIDEDAMSIGSALMAAIAAQELSV
jgi:amidohydrolase